MKPVLEIGATGELAQRHMCPLNESEETTASIAKLAAALRRSRQSRRPLLRALLHVHGRAFATIVCFGLVHAVTSLAAPFFLRELLTWLRTPDAGVPRGLLLAASIALSGSASWLAIAHAFFRADKLAVRIRAGLVGQIYRKALTGDPSADPRAGRVLNVLSSDVERAYSAPGDIAIVIMSLVILAIAIGLLWMMLGIASIAGILVLAALVPISRLQTRWMQRSATRAAHAGDKRIGLLGDIMRGIRAVKLSALELPLKRKVEALREPEIAELRRFSLQSAALNALFLSAPLLVAFAVFGMHAALGRSLDMSTAFSAIAIFGLLRPVMLHLPALMSYLVQDRAALARIEAVLAQPDVTSRTSSNAPAGTVSLSAVAVGWGDTHVLENVRFAAAPGELVTVLGPVGAGKTTLIGALLGQARTYDGAVDVSGHIAYAPHEPFLFAGTLRDNVLFGAPYVPARFQAAVFAACLEEDIAAMPDRDATQVGERGTNLSGGQRQRLSLARAIYADADVVILDDPLRGLDALVAAAVRERALLGALAGRTRIIVTDSDDIAQRADQIVSVNDGAISCSRGVSSLAGGRPAIRRTEPGETAEAFASVATEEGRGSGAIPRAVYGTYVRALCSPWLAVVLLALFVAREVAAVGADYWLASWSTSPRTVGVLVAGFGALALATVLVTFARGVLGAKRGIAAAKWLHTSQVEGILGSPMSFFETTPLGRLVNRLSRDQRVIDQQLSPSALEWLGTVFLLLSTILTIIVASPWAVVAIALIATRYYRIQRYFRGSVRDLRRLDAVARSPLLAHVTETLAGSASIRAFGAESHFEGAAHAKLDASQRTMLTQEAVRSWISVRLDLLGSMLAGVAALVAVLSRSAIDPRLAALSITYAMVVTYTLGRAVRASLEVESNMSAVERVHEYALLPAERRDGETKVPRGWPMAGEIELVDVQMRYRAGLPLALAGVSLHIEAGEKVAIVGRTGSGKSSLVAALFRLIELSGGTIRIDGVDIAGVSLAQLRRSLTVISQDAFLFQGTVRENLDPHGDADDAMLWDVLQRAHAAHFVRALPRGLNTEIGEGGAVMSAGQRQLFCIARALLNPSKVVVLDEITASVDAASDRLVRDMVLRELGASTVIMIAHRMDLTYAYNRVIVMDGGSVADVGAPRALLANRDSAFSRLARAYANG